MVRVKDRGVAAMQELAGVLGVSPGRVRQLRQLHDDFPKPALRTVSGRELWDVEKVKEWDAARPKRPGVAARADAAAPVSD